MCCNKTISICFLVVFNIIVLLVNLAILIVLIWANANWDYSMYMDMIGFENSKIIYYIMYGVIGGIAFVALLGLIACCCSKKVLMTIYAILVIIFLIILSAITLAWLGVFIYVLTNLHKEMVSQFKEYKGETGTNAPSIAYNVMFVALKTCGVDDKKDFKKYNVKPSSVPGFENASYPLTCCEGVTDRLDTDKFKDKEMTKNEWEKMKKKELKYFEKCDKNANDDGAYPVLKKYITILFVVVLLFLVALWIILSLLACAACSIRKRGAKDDKWNKHNSEDNGEKTKLTAKTTKKSTD